MIEMWADSVQRFSALAVCDLRGRNEGRDGVSSDVGNWTNLARICHDRNGIGLGQRKTSGWLLLRSLLQGGSENMRLLARLGLLGGAAVIAACSAVTHKAVPTSSSRLLSADAAGGCTLQKGSTSETLLVGSVVLDKEHVENRGLLLSGGHIKE